MQSTTTGFNLNDLNNKNIDILPFISPKNIDTKSFRKLNHTTLGQEQFSHRQNFDKKITLKSSANLNQINMNTISFDKNNFMSPKD